MMVATPLPAHDASGLTRRHDARKGHHYYIRVDVASLVLVTSESEDNRV